MGAVWSEVEPGGSMQSLVKAWLNGKEYRNKKSLGEWGKEQKLEVCCRKLISGVNKAQHAPSRRGFFLPGSTEAKPTWVLCCQPRAGDSSQAFQEGTDSCATSSWRNAGKM